MLGIPVIAYKHIRACIIYSSRPVCRCLISSMQFMAQLPTLIWHPPYQFTSCSHKNWVQAYSFKHSPFTSSYLPLLLTKVSFYRFWKYSVLIYSTHHWKVMFSVVVSEESRVLRTQLNSHFICASWIWGFAEPLSITKKLKQYQWTNPTIGNCSPTKHLPACDAKRPLHFKRGNK